MSEQPNKRKAGRPRGPVLVTIGASIPPELNARLREVAAANGRTISAEVRRALQQYLGSPASA